MAFVARLARERGEELPYTMRFLVGNNEETNMGDLDWYLENYDEPAFAFSPDADFPLICGEKGVYHAHFASDAVFGGDGASRIVEMDGGTVANAIPSQATALVRATAADLEATDSVEVVDEGALVRLVAHGRGGHASMPEGTVNAIGLLVDYLLEHDLCSDGERTFLELQRLVCSCGHDGASLGIKSADDKFGALTVIGGTVRLEGRRLVQTLDCRYPTSIDDERLTCVLDELAQGADATFGVDAVKVPFYLDPTSAEVRALLGAHDHVTGKTSQAITIGGGTYARKFTRACAFGPHDPDEATPAWVGPEHGPDEGVSEESLKRAMRIYIHAILNLMELEL
jgi:succinyl-diaminopimelate desuccinylase